MTLARALASLAVVRDASWNRSIASTTIRPRITAYIVPTTWKSDPPTSWSPSWPVDRKNRRTATRPRIVTMSVATISTNPAR